MKHKRLKALHLISQPFSDTKYSSLLTQQYETNELRNESREASRGFMDCSKFLSMEEERIIKDDDDMEIQSREIEPDEIRAFPTYNNVYKAIDRIQEKKQFYN